MKPPISEHNALMYSEALTTHKRLPEACAHGHKRNSRISWPKWRVGSTGKPILDMVEPPVPHCGKRQRFKLKCKSLMTKLKRGPFRSGLKHNDSVCVNQIPEKFEPLSDVVHRTFREEDDLVNSPASYSQGFYAENVSIRQQDVNKYEKYQPPTFPKFRNATEHCVKDGDKDSHSKLEADNTWSVCEREPEVLISSVAARLKNRPATGYSPAAMDSPCEPLFALNYPTAYPGSLEMTGQCGEFKNSSEEESLDEEEEDELEGSSEEEFELKSCLKTSVSSSSKVVEIDQLTIVIDLYRKDPVEKTQKKCEGFLIDAKPPLNSFKVIELKSCCRRTRSYRHSKVEFDYMTFVKDFHEEDPVNVKQKKRAGYLKSETTKGPIVFEPCPDSFAQGHTTTESEMAIMESQRVEGNEDLSEGDILADEYEETLDEEYVEFIPFREKTPAEKAGWEAFRAALLAELLDDMSLDEEELEHPHNDEPVGQTNFNSCLKSLCSVFDFKGKTPEEDPEEEDPEQEDSEQEVPEEDDQQEECPQEENSEEQFPYEQQFSEEEDTEEKDSDSEEPLRSKRAHKLYLKNIAEESLDEESLVEEPLFEVLQEEPLIELLQEEPQIEEPVEEVKPKRRRRLLRSILVLFKRSREEHVLEEISELISEEQGDSLENKPLTMIESTSSESSTSLVGIFSGSSKEVVSEEIPEDKPLTIVESASSFGSFTSIVGIFSGNSKVNVPEKIKPKPRLKSFRSVFSFFRRNRGKETPEVEVLEEQSLEESFDEAILKREAPKVEAPEEVIPEVEVSEEVIPEVKVPQEDAREQVTPKKVTSICSVFNPLKIIPEQKDVSVGEVPREEVLKEEVPHEDNFAELHEESPNKELVKKLELKSCLKSSPSSSSSRVVFNNKTIVIDLFREEPPSVIHPRESGILISEVGEMDILATRCPSDYLESIEAPKVEVPTLEVEAPDLEVKAPAIEVKAPTEIDLRRLPQDEFDGFLLRQLSDGESLDDEQLELFLECSRRSRSKRAVFSEMTTALDLYKEELPYFIPRYMADLKPLEKDIPKVQKIELMENDDTHQVQEERVVVTNDAHTSPDTLGVTRTIRAGSGFGDTSTEVDASPPTALFVQSNPWVDSLNVTFQRPVEFLASSSTSRHEVFSKAAISLPRESLLFSPLTLVNWDSNHTDSEKWNMELGEAATQKVKKIKLFFTRWRAAPIAPMEQ